MRARVSRGGIYGLLANQIDELSGDIDSIGTSNPPTDDVIEELRDAQTRLALEQARAQLANTSNNPDWTVFRTAPRHDCFRAPAGGAGRRLANKNQPEELQ